MKHEIKMLLLAIAVVACFIASAIVISYRSYELFALFLFAGFALMGVGFKFKSDYQKKHEEE
ncbi:hypothetical protein J2R98_000264 [Alkalibacillus filiformis]|uniref:Lipoprotein n=1 Tax=Alkalibacillus filiformis TaxID=200990 RepID=A0ABU0DPV5_9BACI|nr:MULTISPECIES: DUF5325 family protein [Alkalibacillus]MDQ0350461.1 hypothetical protein [Alkalibacillus filiformis]